MKHALLAPPYPESGFPNSIFHDDSLNTIWDMKVLSGRTKLLNSITIFYKDKNPLNKMQGWILVTDAVNYYTFLNTFYIFMSSRRNTLTLKKGTIFEWKFFRNKSLSNLTGWKDWKTYKFETIKAELIITSIIHAFAYYNLSLLPDDSNNPNTQLENIRNAIKITKYQWLPHLKQWTRRNESDLPYELTLNGCLFYIDLFEMRFLQIVVSMTPSVHIEELTKHDHRHLEDMKRPATLYAKLLNKSYSVLNSIKARKMDNYQSNLIAEPFKYQEYLTYETFKYRAVFGLLLSFQAAINSQELSASILADAISGLDENKLDHPLLPLIRTWYKSRFESSLSVFEQTMKIDAQQYIKYMECNLALLFDETEKYEQDFSNFIPINKGLADMLLQTK